MTKAMTTYEWQHRIKHDYIWYKTWLHMNDNE